MALWPSRAHVCFKVSPNPSHQSAPTTGSDLCFSLCRNNFLLAKYNSCSSKLCPSEITHFSEPSSNTLPVIFLRLGPSHVTFLSKKYTLFVFGPQRTEHCEADFSRTRTLLLRCFQEQLSNGSHVFSITFLKTTERHMLQRA